jgi:hypothetical protein
MKDNSVRNIILAGAAFVMGMFVLGYLLSGAIIKFREYERSVTVKGLSEREYSADVVIWPIQFIEASNDLQSLYKSIDTSINTIKKYLKESGIEGSEASVSSPSITDKSAQSYGGAHQAEFRYTAIQTVTVYSNNIDLVRSAMNGLSNLGKKGIAFTGGDYQNQTEYLFTRLNEIKPEMIQEATTKAREVALKFAEDSKSRLGKIKRAYQGQFSINPRDRNNPHIKKIRVVSTVEYYLSD